MRKSLPALACCFLAFSGTAFAVHLVPDKVSDPHFTSGPCPMIVPLDGAACADGETQCPAFYNPALLPDGYNSVSYCASVPAQLGFGVPSGFTFVTMPLDLQERQAFLKAVQKTETFVKDGKTVTMEVYKVGYLYGGVSYVAFGGNEYWNPVCAADALLPPFSNQAPQIIQNPDGSSSYANLPETYTVVLDALKAKNARNRSPMELIDHLPSYSQINVEWPAVFYAWQQPTNLSAFNVQNFLVSPSIPSLPAPSPLRFVTRRPR